MLRTYVRERLGERFTAMVRMHADEQHTDAPLVRRLLAAQFPKWSALPIERIPSHGTDNALYRLGDNMVVRLPRIQWAVDMLERERRWLPVLAPQLPLAIPTPLAHGTPANGYPWRWSVYRWLDGDNPTAGTFADARRLARFLVALERIDATGAPPGFRGQPLETRDEQTRAAIGELTDTIDTAAATAMWEEALAAPQWAGAPVWVHGDIAPGNLLVDEHGRLTAVLDFGGIGVGDPACDLIVAWNLLPAEGREVFRNELGADDDTWTRGRGWALSLAVLTFPYYKDTNRALVDSARHVLQELSLAERD